MIHMGIKMAAKWASREYTFMFHIQMLYVRRRRRRLAPRRKRKIARIQRRIVSRPEVKRRLLDLSETPVLSSPAYSNDLNNVPQGVDEDNRVGNRMYTTSYYGKFYCHGISSGPCNMRIVVYTPKDPAASMSGVAYNTHIDADAYTVWQDIFVPFAAAGPNCKLITLKKKWRYPMKTIFEGSTATAFSAGRLKIYVVSDQSSSDPQQPTIAGHIKCFYKDP